MFLDEPVHAMDSLFYYNFLKDVFSKPQILFNLKEYVSNFYARYPVLYLNEYPPLNDFFVAFTYALFGINNFSSRFVIPFFSVLCLYLVYLIGKKMFNETIGVVAAIFLSSIPYFFIFSQILMLDIPVLFFILLSFYLFLNYLETKKRITLVLFLITTVLGFYVKYPAAVVYPFILLYLFVRKKINLDIIIISIIFLTLTIPYILFLKIYVGQVYTLDLLTGKLTTTAFWDLPKIFASSPILLQASYHLYYLIYQVPLILLIFLAISITIKRQNEKKFILTLWILSFLLVFTLIINKAPPYNIYIFAPICLLAAFSLNELFKERQILIFMIVFIVISFLINLNTPLLPTMPMNLKSGNTKIGSEEVGNFIGRNIPNNSTALLIADNYGFMCYDCAMTFNFIKENNFRNNLIRARDCLFLNMTKKEFYSFLNKNNVYYIVGLEQNHVYSKFLPELETSHFERVYDINYLHVYKYKDVNLTNKFRVCNFNCKLNMEFCT
jgi:hypothetical protein